MHPEKASDLEWRRLQVHEQQSEREKKSLVQKTLIFAKRAREKQDQELETFGSCLVSPLVMNTLWHVLNKWIVRKN